MALRTAQDLDWSNTTEAMAREIISRAEIYLQSQLQAGIAADQRAVTLAGMFIATATAIALGVLAVWSTTGDIPLLTSGIVSAGFLTIASGFCMWAARPIDFFFPGS